MVIDAAASVSGSGRLLMTCSSPLLSLNWIWTGSDALWKRIEWATTVAKATATSGTDPAAIGHAMLGPMLRAETLAAIYAAESPAQGLALLLVSPEFQRR